MIETGLRQRQKQRRGGAVGTGSGANGALPDRHEKGREKRGEEKKRWVREETRTERMRQVSRVGWNSSS